MKVVKDGFQGVEKMMDEMKKALNHQDVIDRLRDFGTFLVPHIRRFSVTGMRQWVSRRTVTFQAKITPSPSVREFIDALNRMEKGPCSCDVHHRPSWSYVQNDDFWEGVIVDRPNRSKFTVSYCDGIITILPELNVSPENLLCFITILSIYLEARIERS